MATFKDYMNNPAHEQRILTRYFFYLTNEERETFKNQTTRKHCPDCKNRKIDRIFCDTCNRTGSVKYLNVTKEIERIYNRIIEEFPEEALVE